MKLRPVEIKIDMKQAFRVFNPLIDALRSQHPPYHRRNVPQELIPQSIWDDKLLLSRFLFYSCYYMRGPIRSDHVFVALARAQATIPQIPDIFDPSIAKNMSQLELAGVLSGIIGFAAWEIAGYWIDGSRILDERYGGDPRNIFRNIHDQESLKAAIVNKSRTKRNLAEEPKAVSLQHSLDLDEPGFLGFQEKMASMLFYFLRDAGLIRADLHALPPVDFHLLRIMLSTDIIILIGGNMEIYDNLVGYGFKVVRQYLAMRKDVLPTELGDALWLGSRDLCSQQPGNSSSEHVHFEKLDISLLTPEERLDFQAKAKDMLVRSSRRPPAKVDWSVGDTREAYARSCEICAAQKFCTKSVPQGYYYSKADFRGLVVHEKQVPPQGGLLFEKVDVSLKPRGVRPRPLKVEPLSMVEHHLSQPDFGWEKMKKKLLVPFKGTVATLK